MTSSWLDLIEGVGLTPSLLDLATWEWAAWSGPPSWQQIAVWFGAMIVYRLVLEPLEHVATFRARRGLFKLAAFVKP